jgi:hydrogenase expression/formation protein HypE
MRARRKSQPLGKMSNEVFDKVIFPNLGAKRAEVLVGPSTGVDTCVIKVGSDHALVCTTDPLSFIPRLGPEESGKLCVDLIASDLSTSGFRPQYAVFDFNLPPSMDDITFEKYWKSISSECSALGTAIVGGHTARFEGADYTVVGGGSMFSVGAISSYLTSSGGETGDKIILTKSAAIAATGILSRVFRDKVRSALGEARQKEAAAYLAKISVVQDALSAVKVGVRSAGVSAMHDVTEGGVLSALYEVALASSLGIKVSKSAIPVSEVTRSVCALFGIDPLESVGEGSLLVVCKPSKVQDIVDGLASDGIPAAVVAELTEPSEGRVIDEEGGSRKPLDYPITDPYWKAYYAAVRKKWS